jgi:hypothetical protein
MNAPDLTKALRGRWLDGYGIGCCPSHDDHTPSLSISSGENDKILVKCHAGCDQRDVIAALMARGLWHGPARRPLRPENRQKNNRTESDQQKADRSAAALAIWQSTIPAAGTLAEAYLASRGLTLPLRPSLRFHRGLKHPSSGMWPCMVALVTRGADDLPLAIHRTFLARDGAGKAPVKPQKMMFGPCRGGAVRLGVLGGLLMVGEGIETCFAAMQSTGHPAWAALSTSGLCALDLPDTVRDVIVLADGDPPGERAAQAAAIRWRAEGRSVRVATPPAGCDFNDLLRQPG